MLGDSSSTTVTTCVAVVVFPDPSVTVHVTVVSPNGNAVGALLTKDATEQLSVVVGVPKLTLVAVHPVLVFTVNAVGAVILGGSLSITVTVAAAELVLPLTSVTSSVTEFVPISLQLKLEGDTLIEPIPQASEEPLSIISAVILTFPFSSKFTETSCVTTVGFVLSKTVTISIAVVTFPALSVAVHVTSVLPNGNIVGALLTKDATEQLSVAIGVSKVTFVAVQPVSIVTVTFAGVVILGDSSSNTVTFAVAELELPLASVTVNNTGFVPIELQLKLVGSTTIDAIPQASKEPLSISAAVILAFPVASMVTEISCTTAVGAVLSITVTICVAVTEFPELSVTVHITEVLPSGNAVGALLLTDIVQLSLVVGVPKTTLVAVHPVLASTVISAGAVRLGTSVSTTVTNCVAVLVFSDPSVTVHVTVVSPNGNAAGASFERNAPVQLSPAAGVPKLTLVAVHPVLVSTVTFAGAVMLGISSSTTVTTCVTTAVFPELSVTVHVTVVSPNGNTVGALFVMDANKQLSVAIGVSKVTFVAVQPVSVLTLTATGVATFGSKLSTTVTLATHVAICPELSVTVKVTEFTPRLEQSKELDETASVTPP